MKFTGLKPLLFASCWKYPAGPVEADWEVEIGGDAPVIDAHWSGFIDLQNAPELAVILSEVGALPSLANALVRLNARSSPVWTSKCDVWQAEALDADELGAGELGAGELDADELDAPREAPSHFVACYIDLLAKSDQQWLNPTLVEMDCKAVCSRLKAIRLRCCRVDLVIRRAVIAPALDNLGITAYITACGVTEGQANAALAQALDTLIETILTVPLPNADASKLQ